MHHNVVVFRTTRLLVRKLNLADLPAYRSVEGNPQVMRLIIGRARTGMECKERLLELIHKYDEDLHAGVWAVIELSTGQYIGTASLFPLPNSEYLQIGYKLRPAAQGKGYATELAQALLHYAFSKARQQKVMAVTHTDNKASQRVLEKAGMQPHGYHQAYGLRLSCYSLEKAEYLEGLRKRG